MKKLPVSVMLISIVLLLALPSRVVHADAITDLQDQVAGLVIAVRNLSAKLASVSVSADGRDIAIDGANLNLGADQNVTVSGTGAYKRGSRVRHQSAFSFVSAKPPAFISRSGSGVDMSNGTTYWAPLILEQNEQLNEVTLYTTGSSAMSTYTVNVKKLMMNVGGTTPTSLTIGTAPGSTTGFEVGGRSVISVLTENVSSTAVTYYIEVVVNSTSAGGGTMNLIDIITTVP